MARETARETETLEVLRWAHGGDGVARLGEQAGGGGAPARGQGGTAPPEGLVVFVPRAVPGDRVRVEIVKRRRRWARGRVVELLRPSPHRVTPRCAVQGACGGCPWMAGDAQAQRDSHLAILRGEARKRLGWTDDALDARVTLAPRGGPAWGYRVRLRLGWEVRAGRVTLGFRAPESRRLVDVARCEVAHEALNDGLPAARAAIQARVDGPPKRGLDLRRGEVHLVVGAPDLGDGAAAAVVGGEAGGEAGGRGDVAALFEPALGPAWTTGPARVLVRYGRAALPVAPGDFSQANPAVTAVMAEAVAEAAGELAGGHAVELFAGAGTFTVALLRAGLSVDAYEGAPGARAAFQRVVAPWAGAARWHLADLGLGVPRPAPRERPDLVLLDPPRAGAAAVIPWVVGAAPRAVLAVSCDLATGLRDLRALQVAGYRVERLTGYEMFPHTGHLETLAVCRR